MYVSKCLFTILICECVALITAMMMKQLVLTQRCQLFQQFNCLHNTFSRDLSLVIIGSHPTSREDALPHPIPFDFHGETDLVFLQVLPFNA